MCELLAMNSRLPTNINFSLHEFARHGGETGPHSDGWGIAYAMGRDFRIIKEAEPAAESDYVRYIEQHHFRSTLVISHIRRATIPKVLSFENTHPFDRELLGRRFLLAHNGHLPGLDALADGVPRRFHPLGATDSEALFCMILDRLAQRVGEPGDYRPTVLLEILREMSPRLLEIGRCNLLLSDGEVLFAHGDHSLHSVCRHCAEDDTHDLHSADLRMSLQHREEQFAAVVATVPLTDGEGWRKFDRGEIRTFSGGEEIWF